MNSGPHSSSSTGRLMLCTKAHRCPFSPAEIAIPAAARERLEDHRERRAVGRLVEPPHVAQAAIGTSARARRGRKIFVDRERLGGSGLRWSSVLLGVGLDALQLRAPVPREQPAPLVDGAQRVGVGPVERVAAVATGCRRGRPRAAPAGASTSTAGWLRDTTIEETDRSSPASSSRMCRRRGSAMALNGTDRVDARGMSAVIHSHMGMCQTPSRRETTPEWSARGLRSGD